MDASPGNFNDRLHSLRSHHAKDLFVHADPRHPPLLIALALLVALATGCRAAPTDSRAPGPQRVRVLSYNIRRGFGTDDMTDLARAARVIEAAAPDVVCLQEVDHGVERSGRALQTEELAAATGLAGVFGPFFPYQGGEYGMALLCALPLTAWENHRLPDGEEPRTALTARLALPGGGELVVSSVHLYRTQEERLAQAQALLALHANETSPVLLVGDFNSHPGGAVMELLEQSFERLDPPAATFPAGTPLLDIDHVLARPGARVRVLSATVLDEPVASDHRPLLVELELSTLE